MMSSKGNDTLDRIQQEIKQTLEREEELRSTYTNLNNGNYLKPFECVKNNKNGCINKIVQANGESSKLSNSLHRFLPNPSAKGLMHKFLKMRGKSNISKIQSSNELQLQLNFDKSDVFEPAKVTVEPGKSIRNGFVPAKEKMQKELKDFRLREAELRKERRKSQPNLMATLEVEDEIQSSLTNTKSLTHLFSTEDLLYENNLVKSNLKPARSLAQLCDDFDSNIETPGTHSLIMQFESLKK